MLVIILLLGVPCDCLIYILIFDYLSVLNLNLKILGNYNLDLQRVIFKLLLN